MICTISKSVGTPDTPAPLQHFTPRIVDGYGKIASKFVFFKIISRKNGPSGNRTRVLGFEAQEDILYPMDPSHLL